jgi:transketolase
MLGKKATREGFGDAMVELGHQNPKVIVLTADLGGSLKLKKFIEAFPDRFYQCGIAEANMVGIAAGLATAGYLPFTATFANFSTSRVFDQVRQSVAYSGKNVKLCASHAGLTLGEDGATHQVMEDIAMMNALPHMTVINPCDYNQTYRATMAIAAHHGPVYLRFGRPSVPIFFPDDEPFVLGRAWKIHDGNDITLFATGHMTWKSVEAAQQLEEEGHSVEVINLHTIKPLDEEAVLASVAKTGRAVVAEEHQRQGGLGAKIAALLAERRPASLRYVALDDRFGESGKPEQLLSKYGLDTPNILEAARQLLG